MMNTAIVWFRQDLRLADQPALSYACQHFEHVIPLFIDDPTATTTTRLGSASRVWLHHSLQALQQALQQRGSQLILRQGEAQTVLNALLAETGAQAVLWNRCYEPASLQRDKALKAALQSQVQVKSFNGNLLREPWETLKADGQPYKVFTPFWKAMQAQGLPQQVLAEPEQITAPRQWPSSLSLQELQLLPRIRWDKDMMQPWSVGEAAAQQHLMHFLQTTVQQYEQSRNQPAQLGTSRLSPHLHFGEISPRQVVAQARQWQAEHAGFDSGVQAFVREIAWREFATSVLYHFPHSVTEPLDSRFAQFPWAQDIEADYQAWQQGRTGIPIIDAGMRELWQSGWMHNRVRMIVASWLCKNLLIPWQQGEQWFRDTLVDADLANNVLGWQWVAGSGVDAAPYFRIFNPVLQGEKFDPQGEYVLRWVPELAGRPLKELHHPRERGDAWRDYPLAQAELKASRQRALDAFAMIKS